MRQFDNTSVLAQLADALPFGIYIVDLEHKIHFWNRAAETITGHLRHEVIGRKCCDGLLVHCGCDGACACASENCPLMRPLRDGEDSSSHLLVRHKDGYRVPVIIRSLPLRGEHGSVIAVAEVFYTQGASSESGWMDKASLHPTLGIPSLSATQEQLRQTLATSSTRVGVVIIEIDGARELEQRRGATMLRAARAAVAHALMTEIRGSHWIGCWTRERFLVLVSDCTEDRLACVQKEIRGVSNGCEVVWWGDRVALTLRVTEAVVAPGETFDSVLQKTDTAADVGVVEAGDRL